jgi:hypothetical protein
VAIPLHLPPARASLEASLSIEVPAAENTLPVESEPLTLRWDLLAEPVPEVEPFDAGDYLVLMLLVTIGGGITPDVWDSIATLTLFAALTSRPQYRAALLAFVRRLQGR